MQDKEEERSLINVERKLSQDGYTADFTVRDGRLHTMDTATERSYGPEEVTIMDFYRFEGESDPDDMSILYALQTRDGLRGTISSAYGAANGDTDALGFLKQVEDLGKDLDKDHK